MKKILTISTILVVLLMLSVLPVFANEEGTIATATDITNEDTLHNTSSKPTANISYKKVNETEEDVTITYSSVSLKVLEQATNREEGYAWLGVRLTPKNGDSGDSTEYKKAELIEGSSKRTIDVSDDSGKSVDYYVPVSLKQLEDAVKNGSTEFTYVATFNWLKNDETSATESAPKTVLTVKIKLDDIKLYDKDNSEDKPLWNEEIYETEVAKVEAEKKAAEEAQQKTAQKDKTPKTGI